ncbi:PTS sugar transporter subunit IIC [Lederbergia sp. NSJ-179]|uniref:PTS mannose/fructose/sorbose/N-acetylgalactosamine transporter subunit IIC n=1 Tax=Lederbergia sp. NSJ-179 TaxID=2931402 RepID=UPI001FD22271|nr:PTS sugar transporter subunit IIC [Lederbergia sp. NSJ-179]MCJ7843251.1 PTS sugar transporter subunit IIC [Lederbergia sp. NSJ-179]
MTALLLFIAALLMGAFDLFVGRNMFNRPIMTGWVVGLILGDMTQGIIIGATLELAFIGLFAVGAAIPPEILSGGMLGTAFAIASGTGTSTALLLAFPIASLALILKNLYMILIAPSLLHKADRYAEKGSIRGVQTMHIFIGTGLSLLLAAIVGISFAIGSTAVTNLLNSIPEFIQNGLQVATLILPALGFALLGRLLISKRVVPYFFIGFALVAYLELPVIAIAVLGAMVALIMTNLNGNQMQVAGTDNQVLEGGEDDEDF